MIAPDRIGIASSTSIAVTKRHQILSGSRIQCMPGARMLMIVVM